MKAALQDRMLLDVLRNLNYEKNILENVKTEVVSKVQKEMDKIPKIVDKSVKEFLDYHLSAHVSNHMSNQISNYLDHHSEMVKIVNSHKISVHLQLEQEVRTIMNNILNDPGYHQMTQYYIKAMQDKYDTELILIRAKMESKLVEDNLKFDQALKNYQQQIDDKTKEITTATIKIEALEKSLFYVQIALGAISIGGLITRFFKF